jgi:hypothetical protein
MKRLATKDTKEREDEKNYKLQITNYKQIPNYNDRNSKQEAANPLHGKK